MMTFVPPCPGALRIRFDESNQETLLEQWMSDALDPWIRVVILTAASIYHEQGASTLRVMRLMGNDEIERKGGNCRYGRSAAISIYELPGITHQHVRGGNEHSIAVWVRDRLNQLFLYGPGPKEVASYGRSAGFFDRIELEVPISGAISPQSLALWPEYGNTGRILSPRQID